MKARILFLCIFATTLASAATFLKKEYFVSSDDVYLSVVTGDTKNDMLLYTIRRNRYLKRVRAKDLLKILHANGYRHFQSRYTYVTFIKKSPLDTHALTEQMIRKYKERYKSIRIHEITIVPKHDLDRLPKRFNLIMRKNALLNARGTVSIVTPKKRRLFFEYFLDAEIDVYKTKRTVTKGEVLNARNIKKERIVFERFRDFPIQNYLSLQAKHRLKSEKIILLRDVERIDLVRRGDFVSVRLQDATLEIDMSAKALQAGGLNDIILIRNSKGKKLRAKVIGKNLVEVEKVK